MDVLEPRYGLWAPAPPKGDLFLFFLREQLLFLNRSLARSGFSSLRRICVRMPTRSSSTLWLMPTEVSINLQSYDVAMFFPSAAKVKREYKLLHLLQDLPNIHKCYLSPIETRFSRNWETSVKATWSSLRMRSLRSVSYALTTVNKGSGQMSGAVTVISFLTYPGIFPGEAVNDCKKSHERLFRPGFLNTNQRCYYCFIVLPATLLLAWFIFRPWRWRNMFLFYC